jgi:hypothetical protein
MFKHEAIHDNRYVKADLDQLSNLCA